MSFESNRYADLAQDWFDRGRYCSRHKQWYLPESPCVECEDGDPPNPNWKDYEDEYGRTG